jgi:hypothetical protein
MKRNPSPQQIAWCNVYQSEHGEEATEIRVALSPSHSLDGDHVIFAEVSLSAPGSLQAWEHLGVTAAPSEPLAALQELCALCWDAARDEHPLSWLRAAACVTGAAVQVRAHLARSPDLWAFAAGSTLPHVRA